MVTKLQELYPNDTQVQKQRYEKLREQFQKFFGYAEGVAFFSAPGRTEVGGNHTDHQRGKVLAAAINLDIVAAAAKRTDGIVTLKSFEYSKYDKIDVKDLAARENEREKSSALIRGICARCRELGYVVEGFDCFTVSNVLKGSGLSSSAAFEVLVVTVISHLFNQGRINPIEAAQIAQYAENVYFGKPSGLLDQMASSVGGFTAMDFAEAGNPQIEKIEFDLKKYGYKLCVVDTGGSHADLTQEYAAIPVEMKKVAAYYGKEVLCQVDEQAFYKDLQVLRQKVGDRAILRAMHFFEDTHLVEKEAAALKAGDFEAFKHFVVTSGRSSATRLQNVFASSAPQEQGLTVALAIAERILADQGAYRVHGGGFAGTIQSYVPESILGEYIEKIEAVFGKDSCYVLSIRAQGGTRVTL